MRKLLILFTTIAAMMACSDSETPIIGGEQGENAETPEIAPLQMRRIIVSTSQGEPQRTTLFGTSVLWNEGDQYSIINQDPTNIPSTTLRITLNEPGSGLGINTDNGAGLSGEVNLKYSGIKVMIGGEDVTSKILSTSTNDNSYKLGVTNDKDHYQYTTIGSEMKAKLFSTFGDIKKTFAIARCTSSDANVMLSENKQAVVTISGIQWRYNALGWNALNENNTEFRNGSKIHGVTLKDVADYHWVHGINTPLTITSEAGKTHGIFEGQIYQDAVIDETTMAVYPTDACKTYKDDILTITLPEHQSYVENSFDHKANIMIGNMTVVEEGEYEGKYDAHFTNAMGVLELTLTGDDYYLENIEVTNRNGKHLWGTASIAAAEYEKGISTDAISGGSPTVTLDCPGVKLTSTPTTFYIVVPVGAFAGGFDVTVTTQDHRSKTFGASSNKNTIAQNEIKQMPKINVSMADVPLYKFNIENSVLQEYLNKGAYSKWGASTYFTGNLKTNCVDQDNPAYYSVKWAGEENSTYFVTLIDETATKAIYTDRNVKGTHHDLINLIPDHTYSYTVKDNSKVSISSGKFETVGRVRMVTIADSWNYRDLGGWTGLNGKKIAYGWIYRGGSLNGTWTQDVTSSKISASSIGNPAYYTFSSDGRQQILDLGIKGELDLRATVSEDGNKDYSHALSLDKNNTGIPNQDWDFMRISTSNAMANPLKDAALVKDVKWIIGQVLAGKPVAFHCKSGADRTGSVAVVILALLGVDPGTIAFEYEITNFSHEQSVVIGKSEIRGKYSNSAQGSIHSELFSRTNISGSTPQQKAYNYLSSYFSGEENRIPTSTLDAFIDFMLK